MCKANFKSLSKYGSLEMPNKNILLHNPYVSQFITPNNEIKKARSFDKYNTRRLGKDIFLLSQKGHLLKFHGKCESHINITFYSRAYGPKFPSLRLIK